HFHTTIYNDVASEKFEFIREIDWNLRDSPELDIFGPNMTCNRINANPFTEQGTKVLEVTAGLTITKAPSRIKVKEFKGLEKNRISIKIPEYIADREYLLQLEYIILYNTLQDNRA
ncbi:unnamed protein product, partial [Clonostachys rhizophaga]